MATAIARTALFESARFTARPSLQRIAGMSSAMALHVVVFGILLMPVAIPIVRDPPIVKAQTPTEIFFVPQEVKPLPPPPIPKPPTIRVRQPPKPVVQPRVEPLVTESQLVETIEPATTTEIDLPVEPAEPEITARGHATLNTLAYIHAPPPQYPSAAKRKGWSGVVVLRVLVDEQGLPAQVAIERSSGRALLDVAAAKQVRSKWRFRPAVRDGRAVKAWASVPIDFTLIRH